MRGLDIGTDDPITSNRELVVYIHSSLIMFFGNRYAADRPAMSAFMRQAVQQLQYSPEKKNRLFVLAGGCKSNMQLAEVLKFLSDFWTTTWERTSKCTLYAGLMFVLEQSCRYTCDARSLWTDDANSVEKSVVSGGYYWHAVIKQDPHRDGDGRVW